MEEKINTILAMLENIEIKGKVNLRYLLSAMLEVEDLRHYIHKETVEIKEEPTNESSNTERKDA